jgi:hypothetical protein
MASVRYWFGYWMSASPAEALAPGDSQDWIAWPYNSGDAITISASPLHPGESQILAVENVRLQGDIGGRRIFFTVRNAGQSLVDGYGMGFSYVSQ